MATKDSVRKPNPIAQRWEALPPARKKQVSLGLGLGAVVLVAFFVVSGGDGGASKSAEVAQGRIQNALLPEEGARDLGVSAVSRDLRSMSGRVRGLENESARIKTQMDREQAAGGEGSSEQRMVDEMAAFRAELSEVKHALELKEKEDQERKKLEDTMGPRSGARSNGTATGQADADPATAARSFGGIRAVKQEAPAAPAGGSASTPSSSSSSGVPVPSSNGAASGAETGSSTSRGHASANATADEKFFLPAGAIISGVLLSGVDAPSGRQAMKDPVPVLVRVKHDAILPNRYRADVKECFMLMETVGDLASERAMMRAVTLSCTRTDRTVMEVPLAGYAVGEDGKAGLRGKVITKQGAVMGKALLAGFADGLSKAFGGGSEVALGQISGEAVEQGGLSGTSSALERISEWYMERADELTPTINIDSGRVIVVVVTKGRDLAPLKSKNVAAGDGRVIGRSRN